MRQAPRCCCIEEQALLRTPDGQVFAGLSYRVDIEGWRAHRRFGALSPVSGRRSSVARIDGDDLLLEDARRYRLEDCDRVRV